MNKLLAWTTELRAWADLIGITIGLTLLVVFGILVAWIKLSEHRRRRK